jgi:hypothetical protein
MTSQPQVATPAHANWVLCPRIRRGDPCIWVTWLTKLLSGESQCEWSAWFRAHHKDYDRLPTDLDVAAWTLEHGQLVRTRREQLLAESYEVFVEDDNAFKRVGKTGIIVSGKPDLVAFGDGTGIIEDCKTGRPPARLTGPRYR